MVDIKTKVGALLRADGMQVQDKSDGLLYAEGRNKDGTKKRRWVWVADADGGLPPDLARRLPQIIDDTLPTDVSDRSPELLEQDPWAFLVVPTLKGISGDLSRQIKERGVTRNTLPQFFDTFYRSTGRETYDTLHEFADLHAHLVRERVPHRFRHLGAQPKLSPAANPDLLANLLHQYQSLPPSPRVRVVTGGAGSGKTILFNVRDSLIGTNALLTEFLEHHESFGDPLRTEVYELERWDANARRTMAWLQLEKRLPDRAADTGTVLRFLARVDASPDLLRLCELPLYCTLLLHQFAEDDGDLPADELQLLNLAIWQLVDREHIKLVGREQEEFVPLSQPLDPVSETAAFPFDAYILAADRANVEQLRPQYRRISSASAQTLEAFRKFDEVRTEFGKKGVVHLLEQVAHAYRRQTGSRSSIRGIRVDELAHLLDQHRGNEQSTDDRAFRALLILKQFAVFNAGGKRDTVDFAHEVMADYLAAGHAAEVLRSNPAACAEAFGELQLDRNSVFHKRLRLEVETDQALAKGLSEALARREIDPRYIDYVRDVLRR